jgi:membrane protein YqaA with SNARE-associated domain
MGDKLLAAMDGRWRRVAVLALSAVGGMPPLLATSVAAGLVRMRRLDFVVCVALGRIARFGAIAGPFLALT